MIIFGAAMVTPKMPASEEPAGMLLGALDSEKAAKTEGGAAADIVWPGNNNWYQSYDNLRFKVDVANAAEVGVFADVSGWLLLTGEATVPLTGGQGVFHQRVVWPFAPPYKYDVIMRYENSSGSWVDFAGANPSDANQYLHPSVKVHTVKIHNTREPNGSFEGSWTWGSVSAIVDRVNAAIPGASSNTIDGLYGQCGSLLGAAVDKTQWRLQTVNTVTVNSGCTDIAAVMDSCGCGNLSTCTALDICLGSMTNGAGQTDNDYAHVYVTDTMGCGVNAFTFSTPAPDNMKIIVASDTTGAWWNEDLGTRVLAHELGHGLGLGHVNSHTWANCKASSGILRNLMCSNAGRILQDSQSPPQCTDIRSSSNYKDWN